MGKFVLREKSYAFAIRIVKLNQYLCDKKKEYVLSRQFTALRHRNWCANSRSGVWTIES